MSFPDTVPEALRRTIRAARDALYPDAVAVLLYGSALAGTRVATSDVDLFVVLPAAEALRERRVAFGGERFQIVTAPRVALFWLIEVSLRAGRPIGLHGLIKGEVVLGELPKRDELRHEALAAMATINERLAAQTLKDVRSAVDTAEAALAHGGAGGTALALRAVPMLLEVELKRAADEHVANRSVFRALAAANPRVVADYAAIGAAAAHLRPPPPR